MTIPVATLLGFAAWTLLLLLSTVGIWRWSHILTGRMALTEFPADKPHGSEGYRRAIRAHANCIENLPVFTVIVLVLVLTQTQSLLIDRLCVLVLVARIVQSMIHITFTETGLMILLRFTAFLTQIIALITLVILIVKAAPIDINGVIAAISTKA